MEAQRCLLVKEILNRVNRDRGIIISNFKLKCRTIPEKSPCCQHKKRYTNKWNRNGLPSKKFMQLQPPYFLTKLPETYIGEKTAFSINGAEEIVYSHTVECN